MSFMLPVLDSNYGSRTMIQHGVFLRGTQTVSVRDDFQLSNFVGYGQGSGLRVWVALTLTITIYLQS